MTQLHQCAGGEMRLKRDFSGAGRQIVWIIQEGERTEVGSSDLKLNAEKRVHFSNPLRWIVAWLEEVS